MGFLVVVIIFVCFPTKKWSKSSKWWWILGRLGRFKCMIQWGPGTQMTLVLIGKGLVLEGSTTKIEAKITGSRYINSKKLDYAIWYQELSKRENDPRVITPNISHLSGQIIIFHQPSFPWNGGISLTKPPFGVRSCEVAIIWPDL